GLASEQPVEAFRRFVGRGSGFEQPLHGSGPAGSLFGTRRPIIAAVAKLALVGKLRHLLECGGSGVVVADPPRGEAGDPRSLARPFAGRALPPGVGDPSSVQVEAEYVINECDAGRGLGARLDGQV